MLLKKKSTAYIPFNSVSAWLPKIFVSIIPRITKWMVFFQLKVSLAAKAIWLKVESECQRLPSVPVVTWEESNYPVSPLGLGNWIFCYTYNNIYTFTYTHITTHKLTSKCIHKHTSIKYTHYLYIYTHTYIHTKTYIQQDMYTNTHTYKNIRIHT